MKKHTEATLTKILAGTGMCLLTIALCMAGGRTAQQANATETGPEAIQPLPAFNTTEDRILPIASAPLYSKPATATPAIPKTEAGQNGGQETLSTAEYLVAAAVAQQEHIRSDPEAGEWTYRGPELEVSVSKVRNEEKGFTYYLADITLKDMGAMQTGFAGENPWGERKHPAKIAQDYGAVLAINGDFFTASENKKGISIRNGKVYYDKKQKADTLAILPDGAMKVYKPGETTAQELLAAGIRNTLTFGPTLVDGGQICPDLKKSRLFNANPRTGIGVIAPKHYIAVVVQGRGWEKSRGINLAEFAEVFLAHGCTVAYNLDGGQSTAMIFMGETLNRHNKSSKGTVFRSVPEVMIFGITKEVDKRQ